VNIRTINKTKALHELVMAHDNVQPPFVFPREFLEWLVENIKGSGFGSTWKTLVAYQKITRCKENIGVERAYGAMFYAYGGNTR